VNMSVSVSRAELVRCCEAGLDTVDEAERGRRGGEVGSYARRGWAIMGGSSDGCGGEDRVKNRLLLMVRAASYSGGYVVVVNYWLY